MRISDWSSDVCSSDLHERRKQVPAPSFYLHLQPGNCFVGAGLWHPETATQRRVRQFIFENPGAWKQAAHAPAFRRRFDLETGEMLVRPPRGFPPDFAFIDDLRHKNFVASRAVEDRVLTRSDERRAGTVCVSTCRSGWSPVN